MTSASSFEEYSLLPTYPHLMDGCLPESEEAYCLLSAVLSVIKSTVCAPHRSHPKSAFLSWIRTQHPISEIASGTAPPATCTRGLTRASSPLRLHYRKCRPNRRSGQPELWQMSLHCNAWSHKIALFHVHSASGADAFHSFCI